MPALSPWPALLAMLLATLTAAVLLRLQGAAPSVAGRYASIDGLRGYLALGVFVHHAAVWYFYLHTGRWALPPSRLYVHLGQGGVQLFFMITGFLFFGKLIDARGGRGIDWQRLFVGRVMRLLPLYLVAMALLLLVVFALSGWTLREPLRVLLPKLLAWLGFTVRGAPDLNGVVPTPLIIAWVTWSLPYEWFFYLALPALALTLGLRPPLPYRVLGLVFAWACLFWMPDPSKFTAFLGGIAAAWLARSPRACALARSPLASLAVLALLGGLVACCDEAYSAAATVLLALAFIVVACGNSIFGWLHLGAARLLGEMAYSVYLLHGIFLFVVMSLAVGRARVALLSPGAYWLLVLGLVPLLVCLCHFSFRAIEQPGMARTAALSGWVGRRLRQRAG